MIKKHFALCLSLSLFFIKTSLLVFAQAIKITNDVQAKKVTFCNEKIKAVLDYNQQANISFLAINGQQVINNSGGIYSAIQTKDVTYSTLQLSKNPSIKITNNTISVSGISYGDSSIAIDKKLDVHSAGTEPASEVNQIAVKVMHEVGIDISHNKPESVNKYVNDK